MSKLTELSTLPFESKKKFVDWLAKNHDKSAGVWLKIAKKATGIPTVTYAEALDVALCYGWIDGQKGSFDDQYFLQRFTRRRPKSIWSKINTEKVEMLIASGEMKPSGLKAVEAAKQDMGVGMRRIRRRRISLSLWIFSPRWRRIRKPKPSSSP